MRLRAVAAGAALLMLSACVVHVTDDGERDVQWGGDVSIQTAPELEPVRAGRLADGRLHVRVDSNGCTDAEDFAVHVEADDDGRVGLGIERTTPDLCKALVPDGVELSWSLEGLGVEAPGPFRLLNPLKL